MNNAECRAHQWLQETADEIDGIDFGLTVDDQWCVVADSWGSNDDLYDALERDLGLAKSERPHYEERTGNPDEILAAFNSICDGPALSWEDDLEHYYDEDTKTISLHCDTLAEILFGAEWGVTFADDYQRCCDCGRFVSTQPNSYCDSGRFLHDPEGGLICHGCVEKDPVAHLSMYLEYRDTPTPIPFIIDPCTAGLTRVEDDDDERPIRFQNGYHRGMDDDPNALAFLLRTAGIEEFVFLVSPSQFYVEWEVWTRMRDVEVAETLLDGFGKLFKAPKDWYGGTWMSNPSLVIADRNGDITAFFRTDNESDWTRAQWTHEDEGRWHNSREYTPDVFEDARNVVLALHRIQASDAIRNDDGEDNWKQVSFSLKQYPSAAAQLEHQLRKVRITG